MVNQQIDENNLISAVKQGSDQAFEKLLENYKNIIVSVCRKYFLYGSDDDDLTQIGTHAFYMAVKSFNEKKNDSFINYAKIVIERALINEIKKHNRKKDIPLDLFSYVGVQGQVKKVNSTDSYNESEAPYISIKTDFETPESIAIQKQSLKETLNKIKNVLSIFELNVLEYYLEGLSYKEIANKLNRPVKSIDNAILRIKNKLKFLKEPS